MFPVSYLLRNILTTPDAEYHEVIARSGYTIEEFTFKIATAQNGDLAITADMVSEVLVEADRRLGQGLSEHAVMALPNLHVDIQEQFRLLFDRMGSGRYPMRFMFEHAIGIVENAIIDGILGLRGRPLIYGSIAGMPVIDITPDAFVMAFKYT